jgi:hypothetical protein
MLDRAELDRRIATVDMPAPHEPWHIATFVDAVLADPAPGVLVECGVYRGVSAAKWSHLAAALGRTLWLFDSFAGLPANSERHRRSIDDRSIAGMFGEGAYAGTLEQAQHTVCRYGVPEVTRWAPGWFEATLPGFREPVAAAYLDVDLAESATTCLRHLWPLVTPGGCIVSQDGDFPLTLAAMREWAATADPVPVVTGLGESKMVVFRRPL